MGGGLRAHRCNTIAGQQGLPPPLPLLLLLLLLHLLFLLPLEVEVVLRHLLLLVLVLDHVLAVVHLGDLLRLRGLLHLLVLPDPDKPAQNMVSGGGGGGGGG